ncbi:CrcB family protein [Amycolatopsis sp. YIM 10]|uniref:fluoride efflux transporter FluC n=1 Tax=Amycolatopsis sp. YIM 10 TaxID=2653857 RepID=UPI0012904E42|nr:CrcB family protein [Amycolatopsis sp. YIM 10]QFU91323.1 Putative fluoride ion transporter CrcB [Amycolatopsis sp. YIM 10]
MTALLVALGGAAGAVLRYLVSRALNSPWGTFVANVAGSALLGFLTGTTGAVQALLGVGLCGALTTYSTFGHETVELLRRGHSARALGYMAATLAAGFGTAALTMQLFS